VESPSRTTRDSLPPIPAKRYFTIGEVSELCGVKPHVLRYWEQEFTQLKPVKRRGNRLDEAARERGHRGQAATPVLPPVATEGDPDLATLRREIAGIIEFLEA
jgi:hypothetical protein